MLGTGAVVRIVTSALLGLQSYEANRGRCVATTTFRPVRKRRTLGLTVLPTLMPLAGTNGLLRSRPRFWRIPLSQHRPGASGPSIRRHVFTGVYRTGILL